MTAHLFCSAKGSPGVTTAVLALAASWPAHREPFIVEADPAGGDVVARLASLEGDTGGLRDTPCTVQLAAASRRGLDSITLLAHAQRLPGIGEVRALLSPASASASTTALTELVNADLVAQLFAMANHDVLIDAGRLQPGSPMLAVVRAAREAIVVACPTLESILHTRELVAMIRTHGARSAVVVVGDRPYSPFDVAEATGAELLGTLPFDPVGAAALAGQARNPKILGRSRLIRAASTISSVLGSDGAALTPAQPIGMSR